ncbi:MAG: PilN domain-containing protein [Deltaproteobacteria bacterium]|nr:PilN domain-containing protein [Deltaproteobacteria bacterium]
MIKINLAPPLELENKYWYIPELVLFALLLGGALLGTELYVGSVEHEIADFQVETQLLRRNTKRLQVDVQRYAQIKTQLDVLAEKIGAIERITVSKIARYLPIILLEHFQNLKPEGMWFTSLSDDSPSKQIKIAGAAFDSLLIAEFISALEETKQQEFDPTDIRTHVFFPAVFLEKVTTAGTSQTERQKTTSGTEAQKALQEVREIQVTEKGSGSDAGAMQKFPELSKFPMFFLTVKYGERGELKPEPKPEPDSDESKEKDQSST